MTWEDILVLTEEALNVAIEIIEERAWVGPDQFGLYHHLYPGGRLACSFVPHLRTTTDYGRCLSLAWRYGINFCMPIRYREAACEASILGSQSVKEIQIIGGITTEHELCVAICRMALWIAQKERESMVYPTVDKCLPEGWTRG